MLHRLRLVLVSPMHAGNVGAVARVAANFDISDIRVVSPLCDLKGAEALLLAKGQARIFLEGIKQHDSLQEALAGCAMAVAFTRRTGALRAPNIELGEIGAAASSATQQTALVFGREDTGLTSDELTQCTHICSFAVSFVMPSLNLSHAVAVACARVYESIAGVDARGGDHVCGVRKERPEDEPASIDELAQTFEHWKSAMVDAGIMTGGNPERLLTNLRPVFARARVTRKELGFFRAYLSKTQSALKRGRSS